MAYGASSITLNDRKNYPYFLRTNPADNLQGHFMVALLKSFKTSKINAVNIIYTDGLYGRTGAEVSCWSCSQNKKFMYIYTHSHINSHTHGPKPKVIIMCYNYTHIHATKVTF